MIICQTCLSLIIEAVSGGNCKVSAVQVEVGLGFLMRKKRKKKKNVNRHVHVALIIYNISVCAFEWPLRVTLKIAGIIPYWQPPLSPFSIFFFSLFRSASICPTLGSLLYFLGFSLCVILWDRSQNLYFIRS